MNEKWKFFDKISFIIMLSIILLGALLVFSPTYKSGENYFTKHLIKISFSMLLFFVVLNIRTSTIFRWRVPLYAALLTVLLLQLAVGRVMAGTKSWIKMGFLTVQISEFAKIVAALFLAKYFTKTGILNWNSFAKTAAIVFLPFVLIALQPDLGTAFMLISLILFGIILKRIKLSIIVFLLVGLLAGSFLMWNWGLKEYQRERIISFMNPEKYSRSSGYQIIQSKIAFGSGGLTGKGFLKGSQSHLRFLPTRHTDFISSVLGEEFGFIGVSVLVLLFFILIYRQFNFRVRSDEEFYFIILFNAVFFFQFLVNILMVTGLFPVMGIPLPLVSYGGSSMLAFAIGEGIIFKMKLNYFIPEE